MSLFVDNVYMYVFLTSLGSIYTNMPLPMHTNSEVDSTVIPAVETTTCCSGIGGVETYLQ